MNKQNGFTLVELVAVLILISVLSVGMFSKFGSLTSANVQASRDDIIAALFFAQQTSMARSGITVVVTSSAISVKENGTPIVVGTYGYPLSFQTGVTATTITLTYDKLGHCNAGTITLTGATGVSATVTVGASGYAY